MADELIIGGGDRNRTRGLLGASETLSLLSYTPNVFGASNGNRTRVLTLATLSNTAILWTHCLFIL